MVTIYGWGSKSWRNRFFRDVPLYGWGLRKNYWSSALLVWSKKGHFIMERGRTVDTDLLDWAKGGLLFRFSASKCISGSKCMWTKFLMEGARCKLIKICFGYSEKLWDDWWAGSSNYSVAGA